MKISWNWLSRHLDLKGLDPYDLAERFTISVAELEKVYETGKDLDDAAEACPCQDIIFEIDNKSLTHRPDLWSHRGIAREIAALTQRKLKPFDISIKAGQKDIIKVSVLDPKKCPRYMALVYDGIVIGDSPFWLKQHLLSVGIRSINNIVDLTNFVMMDVGNPLHAFDIRYIQGKEIIVRDAKNGEKMRTLDGIDRNLSNEDLVIADKEKPIAIAGVMGGDESEIKPDTTTIILESANFNSASVRRTALRHGLRTEASSRFEKSLDPDFAYQAAALFTQMLLEIVPCARVISPVFDAANFSREKIKILLEHEFVNKKLGISVSPENIKKYLTLLHFDVKENNDKFEITVPSFRATKDISIPEDLVEEVGRIHGYDKIKPKAPLMEVKWIEPLPIKKLEWKIKNILSLECSFSEVMSYSFDSEAFMERTNLKQREYLGVKNPISQDYKYMRNSLIPNLLLAAEKNIIRYENFKIYETGRVFYPDHDETGIPKQEKILGGLLYEISNKKTVDGNLFYHTKGYLETLFTKLRLNRTKFNAPVKENYPWKHPVRNSSIIIDDHAVGHISQIHSSIMKNLKIDGIICVFEINLQKLTLLKPEEKFYMHIPRLPGVPFDLSIILPDKVKVAEIEDIIKKISGNLLKSITISAIFRGDPIPAGKKSISFKLYYQTDDRTLQLKEIEEIVNRILTRLKELGGYLRE